MAQSEAEERVTAAALLIAGGVRVGDAARLARPPRLESWGDAAPCRGWARMLGAQKAAALPEVADDEG